MKSQYVDMLLEVAKGILADASLAYPQEGYSFSRDADAISRTVNTRGIGTFLFDLPNLGDMLLRALENGFLKPTGALSTRVSKATNVPRFASGLWLKVFDRTGSLLRDADPNAILFLRQLADVGKKITLPCSPKRLESAVNEYRKVDEELRNPSLDWESDFFDSSDRCRRIHFCDALVVDNGQGNLPFGDGHPAHSAHDRELLENLQRTADDFAVYLDTFNAISASCNAKDRGGAGRGVKHGPGAVAHKSGLVDKFEFPYFSDKLSRVFPKLLTRPEERRAYRSANHEVPARLCAVPKTAKAPRLIAAEPVEHQWFQQLLLHWFTQQFEAKLSDFIDLRDQGTSQKMARQGSLDKSLCTVDLSSASDRLSCWTVERMFRANHSVLSALQSCRTRWLKNSIPGTIPYFLKLKKYASQGTACTFPVQTFTFFVIAMSVLRGSSLEDKLRYNEGKVRVFGDDMILPTYGYARLKRLLHLLQLKVNEDKSFALGNFREACGGDFFNGYDVTPVKVKRLGATGPDLRASLVDTANNFFTKGFWRTAETLGYLLPERLVRALPVVSMRSGTIGLRSFCGSWYAHLPLRWRATTSSVEYRCWGLKNRPSVRDRNGRSRMRKFLLEDPRRGLLDSVEYTSDLLERSRPSDGIGWRALEPLTGFRANRYT